MQRLHLEPDAELHLYMVAEHLHEGLLNYVKHGIEPGQFLQSVIENDLEQAVLRADGASLITLKGTVLWLSMYAPSPCWGSKEKRLAWQATQGRLAYEENVRLVHGLGCDHTYTGIPPRCYKCGSYDDHTRAVPAR